MGIYSYEEDEQEKQEPVAPAPFQPDPAVLQRIEDTTISEDVQDTVDISSSLMRAYAKEQEEVGGVPSITNVDQLTTRAETIERAIERLPGEENTLGLARTGFSIVKFFVDNIVGVANTIAVPLGLDTGTEGRGQTETLFTKPQKVYDSERYEKYFDNLREKEDRSLAGAALSTAKKIFDESPELKNEGEFVKGVIDRLAGQAGTVTAREADELTGYWRAEASTTEQVVRAIPEVIGGTAAGIKFLTRGSKKLVKEAEDIMGKDILKATDEEIAKATLQIADKATFAITNFFKLGGVRKAAYAKRVGAVLTSKQKPLLKTVAENNRAIGEARKKVASARKSKDKTLIDSEEAALSFARRKRVSDIPKQFLEIPMTEVGAVTGATIAGNLYGEEFGALFGALGGGIFSSVGFDKTYKALVKSGQGFGSAIVGFGSFLGALSDEQVKQLAKTGIIPKQSNLTKKEQESLNGFARFIRSLPEEDRTNVYGQLRLLNDIRVDLTEAGVDPELLQTTMGKATGLIPLMMMREAIPEANISLAKTLKNTKEITQLIENERNIEQQFVEFRGLLDRLAGAAGDAGVQNSKFDSFISAMQAASTKQVEEIGNDKAQLDDLVQEIVDLVADPAFTQNVKDKESLSELVEQITRNSLLDDAGDMGDPAVRRLTEEAVPELEGQATRRLEQVEEAVGETETDLVRFLDSFLDPQKYQIDAENAAESLATYARNRKAAITGKARKQFEELSQYGDEIDITDWLDDLYGTADNVIGQTRLEKVKQILKGKKLGNSSTLEALSNIEGKAAVEEALDSNIELKEVILEEFKAAMKQKGVADDVLEGITADNFNYNEIKGFFRSEYAGAAQDFTDFDVFRIAREIGEELDIDLRINATVSDIQEYSSKFSEQARKMYDSKRELSEKMGSLSRSIIDTIPEEGEAGQAIRRAKTNYINNVVMRYRDKAGNPIGYNVDHFNPNGTHKVDPIKWINFNKLISGEQQDGVDLVKQLEKTFGGFYSDTGEYVLTGKAKQITRNLLNDLLARHISGIVEAKGIKPLIPRDGKVSSADKLVEGELLSRANQAGGKILESPALKELEKAGLIDLDRVTQYNLAVDNFFGGTKLLSRTEAQVDRAVKRAAKNVQAQANLRENFLKSMARFGPEQQGATQISDYDSFLNFFILNPQGQSRIDTLLPQVAKEIGVGDDAVKELMSDLTLEAISRASYGVMREARVGQYMRDFDYERLYSLVLDRDVSNTVRGIIGEEKFTGLTRMAQFLMIQNRDTVSSAGVKVTTPKGLGVESLLSRTYSVARGVISPKYVATEVALLGFRKKKAEALSKIMKDPKMVDAVIEIIETNGDAIRKYDPNLFTVLINGLGYHENIKRKEKTESQIRELELDQFRR